MDVVRSESKRRRIASVGIVDSGWTYEMNDPRVELGWTFFRPDAPFNAAVSPTARDRCGHGTRCTALLLSIAPLVSVTPLRVFDITLETSPSVLGAALSWARSRNFDVLSLSLSTARNDCRDYLYGLCNDLQQTGTIIVAASRNGVGGGYPAQFENVIGVSLVDDDQLSYGKPLRQGLDVVVPRGWLELKQRSLSSNELSTSSATALIAGVIVNLLQEGHSGSLAELRGQIPTIVNLTPS